MLWQANDINKYCGGPKGHQRCFTNPEVSCSYFTSWETVTEVNNNKKHIFPQKRIGFQQLANREGTVRIYWYTYYYSNLHFIVLEIYFTCYRITKWKSFMRRIATLMTKQRICGILVSTAIDLLWHFCGSQCILHKPSVFRGRMWHQTGVASFNTRKDQFRSQNGLVIDRNTKLQF